MATAKSKSRARDGGRLVREEVWEGGSWSKEILAGVRWRPRGGAGSAREGGVMLVHLRTTTAAGVPAAMRSAEKSRFSSNRCSRGREGGSAVLGASVPGNALVGSMASMAASFFMSRMSSTMA